jgi:hypothetical protein
MASDRSTFTMLVVGVALLSLGTCVGYYEYLDARRDWNLAERGVESYAWVTRVSPLWSSYGHNRLEDKCELEGLLPEQTQREQPERGKGGALLNDAATYFRSVEPDHERNCRDYLHSWQRVLFDPRARDQARFAFGYRPPLQLLFERSLLFLVLAIVYGCFRLLKRWRWPRAT